MKILTPMLSASPENLPLRFPLLASPKLDGFRAWKYGVETPLSRSNKPLRNALLREALTALTKGFNLDGELYIHGVSFSDHQSIFTREDGHLPDDWAWCVFDSPTESATPFAERLRQTQAAVEAIGSPHILFVPHVLIHTEEELDAYMKAMLAEGYEGVMVRDPNGPYKFGRATEKEGYLTKLKPFQDGEAVVLGFEEQLENTNMKVTNELGRSSRSSAKAGKIGKGTLGKFHVRDLNTGIEFEIGTGKGLTQEVRQEIWDNRGQYLGKIVHYRFQAEGMKDKPRIPSWYGFRDESDM